MRGMLMAGLLVVMVAPLARGQDWLPPSVIERVNQASRIRLESGDGLLVMRRPRVEGNALSGVLRVPKEAPRILGIPITGEGGQAFDWRRSQDTLIPVDRIVTLEVQNGTQWRRGMLIGGAGGAAFGVLGGLVLANLCLFCTPDETQEQQDAVARRMVPIIAANAAIGLAVGTVLGALSPRWATAYRRGRIPLRAIGWQGQ